MGHQQQQQQKQQQSGSGPARPSSTTLYHQDPATYELPALSTRYPAYTDTEVHVLDLNTERNNLAGARYHTADITNASQLLAVLIEAQPDVIINTVTPSFAAPRAVLEKVNVEGTRTLLAVAGGQHGDWSRDGHGVQAFVHTSSSSVVHDAVSPLVNADETYPAVCPNPREYYSETKAQAERLVLAANDDPDHGHMLTCAVRPAGIVGEADAWGFSQGVLEAATQLADWQLRIQLGAGNNLFDVTYVGNVAYALLLTAAALLDAARRRRRGLPPPGPDQRVDGEAFNVTNDSPIPFWDTTHFLWTRAGRDLDVHRLIVVPESLASLIGAASELVSWLTGRKPTITRQSVKYACMTRYYSCDKLKSRAGYEPLVDIEEGLLRAVRSFVLRRRSEQAALAARAVQS